MMLHHLALVLPAFDYPQCNMSTVFVKNDSIFKYTKLSECLDDEYIGLM